MTVIWKPVKDWPYEVSNFGDVRNTRNGNLIAKVLHASGYLNAQLWNKGKFKTCLVHRLVAIAFLGEPSTDDHEVAHSDGNRINNSSSNLRWVTHIENMRDRDKHGTTARGVRNGKLKYSDEEVENVRKLQSEGFGSRRIAAKLKMNRGTVQGYLNKSRRPVLEYKGD